MSPKKKEKEEKIRLSCCFFNTRSETTQTTQKEWGTSGARLVQNNKRKTRGSKGFEITAHTTQKA
jgi:hypothetical protein